MDDLDQFFGGFRARVIGGRTRINDMLANVPFDDLGNQPVESPTTRCCLLKHGRATGVLV